MFSRIVMRWRNYFAFCRFASRAYTKSVANGGRGIISSGVTLNQLDALAFGRGPGSFTGVRIGVGIAQGLALGANLPMIGVSSLMTLAEGAYRTQGHEQVLTAIDARMTEVYCAQYHRTAEGIWLGEDTEAVMAPELFRDSIAQLAGQWSLAGTGWQAYPQLKTVRFR